MAESKIDLILRVLREGDASKVTAEELKEMKGGLTNLEKAALGVRSTIGNLDSSFKVFGEDVGSVADMMSGLGMAVPVSAMDAFAQVARTAIDVTKESISEYSAYVDMIDQMAAANQTSTEEMSRLYQMSQNLRVETGDFEEAMKKMVENGLHPSINNLAALSDEYQTIQDPVQRAQFLLQTFGESGEEFARVMDLGSESIRNQAGEIDDWMLVTEKSQAEVNAYLETMDAWDESIMEIKYSLASALLPTITDVMNAQIKSADEVENSNTAWMNFLPILKAVYVAYVNIKNLFSEFSTDNISKVASDLSADASSIANSSSTITRSTGYTVTTMPGGFATKYNPSGRAGGGDVEPFETIKVGEKEMEYITFGAAGGSVTPASASGGDLYLTVRPMIMTADEMELKRIFYPIFDEWQQGR